MQLQITKSVQWTSAVRSLFKWAKMLVLLAGRPARNATTQQVTQMGTLQNLDALLHCDRLQGQLESYLVIF